MSDLSWANLCLFENQLLIRNSVENGLLRVTTNPNKPLISRGIFLYAALISDRIRLRIARVIKLP
ncbi:MAG: hypothetical protein ACJZ8O_09230 [Pirellulaceae bacterium]